MEELITTVFLVWFNFALGVRDTVTHQAEAAAYYEVEASNNLPERKPLLHHHAHSIGKAHSAGEKASHQSSLAYSRGRSPTPVNSKI